MEYRKMGETGLKLSAISLGSWFFGEQCDQKEVSELVHFAYDNGIIFFDTADKYGGKGKAEILLGKAIQDIPREALVMATKVFAPMTPGPNGRGLSRKHIMEGCNASLTRLGLDYVDIYFCHSYDPEAPLEEVVRAMDDLIHAGKVLYWGTSNWPPGEILKAYQLAKENGYYLPSLEQSEYSLLVRDKVEGELLSVVEKLGIGLVTYGPLNSGLLSGKYNEGIPSGTRFEYREWLQPILTDKKRIDKVRKLVPIAERLDISLPQLAISWLLEKPLVTSVITGASKTRQIKDNLGALEARKQLDAEILGEIEQAIA